MATKEDIKKREDFNKYLNESGLLVALTKVLTNLYELEMKPIDPMDYIRTHLTQNIYEKEKLKIMKAQHFDIITQIQAIHEENMNLAKTIKELENTSNSQLASEEYVIEVEK